MKNRKYNWLILALIVLLGTSLSFTPMGSSLADQVDFPSIYIDGSSAGNGSEASPYSDLSDINWTTGGDNSIFDYLAGTPSESPAIYLDKGATWRETMTVGASGTATYPIVVTSYGSGADPIINGADLVATWTANSATVTPTIAANADNAYIKETAETVNDGGSTKMYLGPLPEDVSQYYRFQLNVPQGSTITASYLTLVPSSSKADGAICTVYAEDVDTAAQITTFANWTTALGRVTTANVSWDFPALTLDAAQNSPSLNAVIQEIVDRGSWAANNYINILLDEDGSSSLLVDFHSNTGTTAPVLHVEYGVANVWQATLTTEPAQVFMDETFGDIQISVAACVNEFDWYWASNVLYCYSTTDPDTAYTAPGVEASARARCVNLSGESYITVDGIHCKYADYNAVHNGTTGDNSTNIIIQNCTATRTAGAPYATYDSTCTDWTIDSNTSDYCGLPRDHDGGVYTDANDTNFIISNNTFSNVGGDAIACTAANGFRIFGNTLDTQFEGGIYINGGDDVEVYQNIITGAAEYGIVVKATNVKVYRNQVSGCTSSGIFINDVNANTGLEIYYNLIYETATGIYFNVGGSDSHIYNNTIANNTDMGIRQDNTLTGILVSNNIIKDNTNYGYAVEAAGSPTQTFANNCCHGNGTNYVNVTDPTGSNGNISVDPLMTDPASDDFTLQATSPCVDAGTDVSLTEDYNSVSVPLRGDMGTNKAFISVGGNLYMIPGAVTEGSPDIGAYEYIAPYKIKDGHLYLRLSEKFYLQIMQPGVNQWLN